jgi:hypothetical protein
MSTPRKFTDSFQLGEIVSITRTKHGWFDGSKGGPIVAISDFTCEVWDEEDGWTYTIEKPRDIHGHGEMMPKKEFAKVMAKVARQNDSR